MRSIPFAATDRPSWIPLKMQWRRARDVAARAAQADNSFVTYCTILGCGNVTSAAEGKGLNRRFCRKHADFYERHGSPYRGSYASRLVNPYRRAAFDWLTKNADTLSVKNAIAGVRSLYRSAGRSEGATSLRGMKPELRARAAWARLREARIDPRLPLAAWLAVEMIIRDDPDPIRTKEFKRVQAAKVIHRIVSGTHKRWEIPRRDGQGVIVTELHKFPMSRGRVLRHIGEDIEGVAELLASDKLKEIRAFKAEQESTGKLSRRAYPRGIEGAPKRPKRTFAKATGAVISEPHVAPEKPSKGDRIEPTRSIEPLQPNILPERDPIRERPYTVTLPDGTIITYN